MQAGTDWHRRSQLHCWILSLIGLSLLVLLGVLVPAPTLAAADVAPCTYVIRPGDTLSTLAQRFATTVSRLALLNDIRNPDLIYAGQRLVIPNCDMQSAADNIIRFPPLLRQSLIDLDPIPAPKPLSLGRLNLARGAAVRVLIGGLGRTFQGSGTVIGSDGRTLLTAYHVVAQPITGRPRGTMIQIGPSTDVTAELIDALPERDLALLRTTGMGEFHGFLHVPIGDASTLGVGDTVYVISYPARLEGRLAIEGGVVIDLLRTRRELRYIVTDAYAGQGSSGGLAINRQGELIGIIDALLIDPWVLQALGYPQLDRATVLIPVEQAMPLLATLN